LRYVKGKIHVKMRKTMSECSRSDRILQEF